MSPILAITASGYIDKSIIITAIVCVTLVAIAWINKDKQRKKQ